MSGPRQMIHRLGWFVLLLAVLPVALLASWQALAMAGFNYPLWHDVIGIDATIAQYGPRNTYRKNFERTTREERSRLFAAIVDALHQRGAGLKELKYHDAQGRAIGVLLRPAEITHLEDVARLVRLLYRVGLGALVVWIALLVWLRRSDLPPPPLTRYLAGIGLTVAVLLLGVIATGTKQVFYAAHTLIFPAGHQWFFYYEESLMTMLMKAPDLFAVIAAEWLLLAGLCYGLCIWMSRRLAGHSQ